MELLEKKTKIDHLHIHASTGNNNDSFIGLKIIGNEVYFYYPIAYSANYETELTQKDIILILKTITLAKTKSNLKLQYYDNYIEDSEFAINSYLWLIKDYLNNGYYIDNEKIIKNNQKGKVNWKKTLENQPIISGDNVIYTNLKVIVKSNVENLISEIYKYCLKISIDYIGWLFNLNSKFIVLNKINDQIIRHYKSVLKQELNNTFDDIKKIRLTHLKNILNGLNEDINNHEFVYGVDNYYHCYEKLIDIVFGNISNKRNFNPKGKWHIVKFDKANDSTDLRPDTLLYKDDKIYIIDAKFYQFGITGSIDDLPETTSIQKQITYGEFAKNNFIDSINNVYNAFILPYDKTFGIFKSNDNIQYIGYAKSTWKNNEEEHDIIHTFLIDLKYLISSWNLCNHDEDINYLVETINKKSKIEKNN